ncbi:hypothetical protein MP638_003859 [Amoeboaphelidium occidentale]|nr:hypothetical protein MP638_003859 [Amoeboaphelidium occidentale]
MKFPLSSSLIVLLALLPFAFADLQWSNCGTAEDAMEISSLTFAPQPQRGVPFKVHFVGKLKATIDYGTIALLQVKWGALPIRVPPVSICDEVAKLPDAPSKCPVQPGDFDIEQEITLPGQIPKGNYKVNIKINNQDGRQVSCLDVQLKL